MAETQNQSLIPATDNTISLGENSKRFSDVYAVEFHGTATYSGSTLSLANQNLGNLADVTVAGVGVDDVLSWSGSAWVPNAICNPTTLSSLTDVDTTGVVSGQVLRFNSSSNKFEAETLTPQSFNVTFTSLTDTPSTLTASGFIKANAGGTALEVVADPGYISDLSSFSTTNLAEGTNLYYTDARFDTRLASKSTSHIVEGTKLYYTDARFDTRLANKTTTNLSEGTNLYFTDARADARITAASLTDLSDVNTGATSGQVLKWNGSAWAPANDVPGSDTDSIPEGSTNLFYTDSRWDTRLGTKTTDNLTEGSSNFYYTVARANSAIDARLATSTVDSLQDVTIASVTSGQVLKWNGSAWVNAADTGHTDTDTLTEGSTNLYYTTARANSAIDAKMTTTDVLSEGTNNKYFTDARVWNALPGTTTDSLPQGSSNQYYTDSKVNARISASNLSSLSGVNVNGATNGQSLVYNSSNSTWIASTVSSGGGISNIVDDTSPQLGGNLDLNGRDITATSNINITTSSTGNVNLNVGTLNMVSLDSAGMAVRTAGTGATPDGIWAAGSLSGSGFTVEGSMLVSGSDDVIITGDLNFTSGLITGEVIGQMYYDHPTTKTMIDGLVTASINGVSAAVGATLADAPLLMVGNSGTSNHCGIALGSTTDGRIHVVDSSYNTVYKLPSTDGSASQVLTTNGSGDLSWTTVSGGASAINNLSDVTINSPSAGQVLKYNGSAWINDTDLTTGGSGTTYDESSFDVKTSNFNAQSGKRYGVNTSSNTITATMPGSPSVGDAVKFVQILDSYGINAFTIDFNGNTDEDSSSTTVITTYGLGHNSTGFFWNGSSWTHYR